MAFDTKKSKNRFPGKDGAKFAEFDQKLIDLRRVARVVSGGRRFNFRATLIIGDRHGRVGLGMGKGADTAISIDKAFRDAKKHLISIPITKEGSIPHEVFAKWGPGQILMRPAVEGRGIVAGSAVRVICDLGGIRNITAKVLSHTKNKINNAKATLEALKTFKYATARTATNNKK